MTVLELVKLIRSVPQDWEVLAHGKKICFVPPNQPKVRGIPVYPDQDYPEDGNGNRKKP